MLAPNTRGQNAFNLKLSFSYGRLIYNNRFRPIRHVTKMRLKQRRMKYIMEIT